MSDAGTVSVPPDLFADEQKPLVNGKTLPGQMDLLRIIAEDEGMPQALRVLAKHLGRVEYQIADSVKLSQQVVALTATVDTLQKQVMHLSQYRAAAEVQLERQTRHGALDLAVKATPEDMLKGDPTTAAATIETLFEAFLGLLKGGLTDA